MFERAAFGSAPVVVMPDKLVDLRREPKNEVGPRQLAPR
jgi:hypothetical protein